jgi:predicted transcriptional regulator of viral defense system
MYFEKFREAFKGKKVITIDDILIHFPHIDRKQLSQWSRSGRLHHPARGIYIVQEYEDDAQVRPLLASMLVSPSYISLEYALSYYGLIPEEVVVFTCVTTRKTESYDLGHFGRYRYQSIMPRAFLSYEVRDISGADILMASPAKAILDFLYYHRDYMTDDDYREWRINTDQFFSISSIETLRELALIYRQKSFQTQVERFISYLMHEYA